jgi:hypothetical protein
MGPKKNKVVAIKPVLQTDRPTEFKEVNSEYNDDYELRNNEMSSKGDLRLRTEEYEDDDHENSRFRKQPYSRDCLTQERDETEMHERRHNADFYHFQQHDQEKLR